MSRVAQDWVARSDVVGNKRFILRELAECHNQTTGRCDPAIKKDRAAPTGRSLNELTGIGEAKLSKLLDELEADGRLIRERRHWKKNGWRASDQFHLAIEGIKELREDIAAGTAWIDDRMTRPKAWTVTPRAKEPKASDRTVPKREFEPPLSVTRAAAYQEGRTGKEETTTAPVIGSTDVADKKICIYTSSGGGGVESEDSLEEGNDFLSALVAEVPGLNGQLVLNTGWGLGREAEERQRAFYFAQRLVAQGGKGWLRAYTTAQKCPPELLPPLTPSLALEEHEAVGV